MFARWISSGMVLYWMMLIAVVEMELRFVTLLAHHLSWTSKPLLAGLLIGYAWVQFERYRPSHKQAYAWMLGLMALATLIAV